MAVVEEVWCLKDYRLPLFMLRHEGAAVALQDGQPEPLGAKTRHFAQKARKPLAFEGV